MNRIGTLLIGLLAAVSLAAASAWVGSSPAYSGPAILGQSGAIRGVVLCGEGEGEGEGESGTPSGPVAREWSTVWVQGLGSAARTDELGRFRIDYVPAGTYVLGVQTAGMPIRGEFEVTVSPRTVTDLGELVVTGGCGACGGEDHEGGEGDSEGCCSVGASPHA